MDKEEKYEIQYLRTEKLIDKALFPEGIGNFVELNPLHF